jgi:fatty-acyl-CoA synthase
MTFLPIVKGIWSHCKTVRQWVALCDTDKLPADTGIPNLVAYEAWIGAETTDYTWPSFDERSAAALCYTSGTTGNPKGVLYSHRSTVLHTMAAALPDCLGVAASDTVLPVVPMFHVNSWGIVYLGPMTGAKLVLPGAGLDGKSLYDLFESEGVTISAGVPTVWQGLLAHVEANGLKFSTMRKSAIGGSACPPAMIRKFRDAYGVHVIHAWGMTEMSPIGTAAAFKAGHAAMDDEQRLAVMSTQGRAVYGVDMKVVSPEGGELPWDGESSGELLVRGPWIIDTYFKGEGGNPLVKDADGNGWFPTGDVAKITPEGYMVITDRSKDVIKSGGEWIGSIDIENIAMSHPAVAMAACIGAKHPKWDERPLLVVVKKPGAEVTKEQLLAFFDGKIAKWWTPDDVQFVDAIPLGATGKMQKNKLRDQFADYKLPTA